MLKRIKDFFAKPFRNLGESIDKHPNGSQIRDYAAVVKVAESNHELIIVVPVAERIVGRLTVEGMSTDEQRNWFAKGYNASLGDISALRRSVIKPTLRTYKEAIRAHNQMVKESIKKEERQAEAAATATASRLPPAGTMATAGAGA